MNKMIKPEPEAMELEETQPGVIEPAWTTEEAKDMSVETHQDTFWPDNQLGLKDYVAPDNPGSPFVSDTPMQLGTPTRSVETEKNQRCSNAVSSEDTGAVFSQDTPSQGKTYG